MWPSERPGEEYHFLDDLRARKIKWLIQGPMRAWEAEPGLAPRSVFFSCYLFLGVSGISSPRCPVKRPCMEAWNAQTSWVSLGPVCLARRPMEGRIWSAPFFRSSSISRLQSLHEWSTFLNFAQTTVSSSTCRRVAVGRKLYFSGPELSFGSPWQHHFN